VYPAPDELYLLGEQLLLDCVIGEVDGKSIALEDFDFRSLGGFLPHGLPLMRAVCLKREKSMTELIALLISSVITRMISKMIRRALLSYDLCQLHFSLYEGHHALQ
jgi:hypothetical protein